MNFRDVELLSAYLDGRLSPSDVARLESRLASDANLKATLEDLRGTRTLLRRLPQRRAPRSFRLTPQMAGVRPPAPRAYPIFRFATALAALLFVASVALNAFTPFAASRLAAAPAPALGLGGGGGYGGGGSGGGSGGDGTIEAPAAATENPAPFAALAPTATAEGTLAVESATAMPPAQDTARASGAEATDQANKATGPFESQPAAAPATSPQPIPLTWIVVLAVVMLVSAVAAWMLRTSNERRIRERWKQK